MRPVFFRCQGYGMGIENLEDKYQRFCTQFPAELPVLERNAGRAACIQCAMRDLLDAITARICPSCTASCCMSMPVEGWFTEGDYFLFRQRYPAPYALRRTDAPASACRFLGPQGCVLPRDLRPFPCVKVNCSAVSQALQEAGQGRCFQQLHDTLGELQQELWPLLQLFRDRQQTQ